MESQPSEKPQITLVVFVPTKDYNYEYIADMDAPEPFTAESLERTTEHLAKQIVSLLRLGGMFPPEPTEGSQPGTG